MIFDEKSILREMSETENKVQGGVSDISSQKAVKGLTSQKRTPQIQMEMNMRLLKSNLDR